MYTITILCALCGPGFVPPVAKNAVATEQECKLIGELALDFFSERTGIDRDKLRNVMLVTCKPTSAQEGKK